MRFEANLVISYVTPKEIELLAQSYPLWKWRPDKIPERGNHEDDNNLIATCEVEIFETEFSDLASEIKAMLEKIATDWMAALQTLIGPRYISVQFRTLFPELLYFRNQRVVRCSACSRVATRQEGDMPYCLYHHTPPEPTFKEAFPH